jgi:trehalose 6-phosphate phosphatase
MEATMEERTAGTFAPRIHDHWSAVRLQLEGVRPVLFLDFDGTLAPIVERPADATMSWTMRERIRSLARRIPVAIVSGRDLPDVRARVGIADLVYAGSHGFDIEGPGLHMRHEGASELLPVLDAIEADLGPALRGVDGCEIERKRFSLAVHFRRVPRERVPGVVQEVERATHAHPGLRSTAGKCVLDVQPDLPWDKGRAMTWILDALADADTWTTRGPRPDQADARDPLPAFPIFVGDDVTDEDAFRELRARGTGIGIVVQEFPAPTGAHFCLDDTQAVAGFLEHLAAALPGEEA